MSFGKIIRQIAPRSFLSTPVDPSESCFWRVDMHSHLIPCVDDGVNDNEQAVECLKQLAAWGIQKIITTPHVSRDWYPNKSETLREGQRLLQTLVDTHNIGLQVEVAAEYLLDEFFPDLLASDDLLTFGDARYLLIELGWGAAPRQLDDLLFRIQTQGYTPVLAHPERYTYYYDNPSILEPFHENGCLFQLNWSSLTGRYGKRAQTQARLFVKKGWIDFLGSDLHRPADLESLSALFKSADYQSLKGQPLLNQTLL